MTSGDSRGGLDRRRRYRGSSMPPQSPANLPTDSQAVARGTRRRNTVTHWDRAEDGTLRGTVVDLDNPHRAEVRLRRMSATLTVALADAMCDLALPTLPPYDENTPVAVTTASEVTPGTYFSLTLDIANIYYRYSTRPLYLNVLTQSIVRLPPTQPCFQADTWIADEYIEAQSYRTVIAYGERLPRPGAIRPRADRPTKIIPFISKEWWQAVGLIALTIFCIACFLLGLKDMIEMFVEVYKLWR